MTFTDAELHYLAGQLLGRLSTIGTDGAPQTRPVGFIVNSDTGTTDITVHSRQPPSSQGRPFLGSTPERNGRSLS